jgi:HEAT repeat protein
LFDVEADPHNINNLAGNDQYQDVLVRMRGANRKWLKETKDAGFIPEPMMIEIAKNQSLYDYAHSGQYPLDRIMETAELASSKDLSVLKKLQIRLNDKNPIIRYWAATGCTVLSKDAVSAKADLEKLLQDTEISVRIAAAEALYHLSEKEKALSTLRDALKSSNVMARVQALNVLETTGKDAQTVLGDIQKLLKDNIQDGDYDVRAAKRILDKMED